MNLLELDPPVASRVWLGLGDLIGVLLQASIDTGLRLVGRSIAKQDAEWLESPLGPSGVIGEEFYEWLGGRSGLDVSIGRNGAGLLPDFDALAGPGFNPRHIRPEIRHFYEHTADYELDTWGETALLPRLFLWGLVKFVSQRMNQLNFPISSLELSRGMSSDVVELTDPRTGRRVHTGWLRKVVATQRVIYAGIYTVGRPANCDNPCVKVMFPVPRGCSTVFLIPSAMPDGSFRLTSSGRQFGDPGFYRLVELDEERWTVRHLRTLKEFFHVYVDDAGTLRTDHEVRFLGCRVLRLHYRLTLRST
jgi:hypothetical protein